MNGFIEQIAGLLNTSHPRDAVLDEVLHAVLQHFHSETGTIHKLDADKKLLHLVAQTGLPPQMLDIIKTIPVGKGIAGETAAKRQPVTICNLQKDSSGVAQPGAKQTGVGGALCVPIYAGDTLVGTFGIGTLRQHEYTVAEIKELQDIARTVGRCLA
jgi:GAF domain-containing protein